MMSLNTVDPQIAKLIEKEKRRQEETLMMIPSENYASPAVLAALGSVTQNKYAEGYPGKRYYQGNEIIDEIENLAQKRAQKLFGVPKRIPEGRYGGLGSSGIVLALTTIPAFSKATAAVLPSIPLFLKSAKSK
jgi:glycine/serine hydroxymethyltransferase